MSVSLYGSGNTIIQAVSVAAPFAASTSSTSYVTTGLSASITPQSTNSKILILVSSTVGQANYFDTCYYTIFRGTVSGTNLSTATNAAFAYSYTATNAPATNSIGLNFLDSPSTTSAVTYTVGFKVINGSNTAYFGNNCTSSITLLEVSGS